MKKLIFALLLFVLLANCEAQTPKKQVTPRVTKAPEAANASVIVLEYTSICCGPPSEMPVLNYVRDFAKSNKMIKPFVYQKIGLGREGEFNLYITLEQVTAANFKPFMAGLQKTVSAQNAARDKSSGGHINFSEKRLNGTEWQRLLDESKNSRSPISTYTY